MAKRKSSLDLDEPVIVQEEEIVSEPTEYVGEAEEKPAFVVKEKKAETQKSTVEKKTKRGVKICVM